MLTTYKQLEIVVATKNRPDQIARLLQSISNSSKIPAKIIIVYHGSILKSQLLLSNPLLNLQFIQSEIASQIFQKKLGLKALSRDCEWVFFLDDDVVIETNTLDKLFELYVANNAVGNYAGFGLAIKNRAMQHHSTSVNFLLYLVKLYSYKPGHVTMGGHPQTYLNQRTDCEVQWLNGISLWQTKYIDSYFDLPDLANYGAYEDVMFSYRVSRKNKLLFVANVYVLDQELENFKPSTIDQFTSASYARSFFVESYSYMSKFWLIVGQVVRNMDFIVKSRNEGTYVYRIGLTCKLMSKIIFAKKSYKLVQS
jgi:glycosyltransferase involved in cell wall biosynthesis